MRENERVAILHAFKSIALAEKQLATKEEFVKYVNEVEDDLTKRLDLGRPRKEMKFIDPRIIPASDLPLLTFSDHSSGLIEWIIKWRTKGTYNHVMWLIEPGKFASQGNTYSIAPAERYMKYGNRLKFVQIVGLTAVQRGIILASINRKLKLPWWRKLYDWPGILGQAVGVNKINVNGLNYCSEDVVSHLIPLIESAQDGLKEALSHMPLHGSPEDLNDYFKQNEGYFKVYGVWDSDARPSHPDDQY